MRRRYSNDVHLASLLWCAQAMHIRHAISQEVAEANLRIANAQTHFACIIFDYRKSKD